MKLLQVKNVPALHKIGVSNRCGTCRSNSSGLCFEAVSFEIPCILYQAYKAGRGRCVVFLRLTLVVNDVRTVRLTD